MPIDPFPITPDAQRADNRLLEALQRGRDSVAVPGSCVPRPRASDATSALIEQAKGALMLRYGVDSHQAFAVLVRWARVQHEPLHDVAHALLRGVCEGNPQIELHQRPLVRWLEAQLRDDVPDPLPLEAARLPARAGTSDSALG